jgi:UDP-glucose 4-epimerase
MNVYGPRQDYKGAYIAVMHKILDRIEQGEPPIVFGDGSQQYDFVHVADVARANILAMEAEVDGECYNVGRGVGTSIKELTELLLRLTGSDLPIRYEKAGLLEEGMRSLIEWRQEHQEVLRAKRQAAGVGELEPCAASRE